MARLTSQQPVDVMHVVMFAVSQTLGFPAMPVKRLLISTWKITKAFIIVIRYFIEGPDAARFVILSEVWCFEHP